MLKGLGQRNGIKLKGHSFLLRSSSTFFSHLEILSFLLVRPKSECLIECSGDILGSVNSFCSEELTVLNGDQCGSDAEKLGLCTQVPN